MMMNLATFEKMNKQTSFFCEKLITGVDSFLFSIYPLNLLVLIAAVVDLNSPPLLMPFFDGLVCATKLSLSTCFLRRPCSV